MFRLLFFILAASYGFWLWHHPHDLKHPDKFVDDAVAFIHEEGNEYSWLWNGYQEISQPAGILVATSPIISSVSVRPWVSGDYTITALDSYFMHGRVLSKTHYSSGREADLSPFDLAMGWQDMSDSAVLKKINISQSDRWYYYRWEGMPPINPGNIPLESGNMHIIPGNGAILNTLRGVVAGNVIYIEGFLINARASDGWQWSSGTSNSGEGPHACKVIWVTKLEIEK